MYKYICILSTIAIILSIQSGVHGQAIGQIQELHPKLSWSQCSTNGQCSKKNGEVVIDANWRWLHTSPTAAGGQTDCYGNDQFNKAVCPNPNQCTSVCQVEGVNTYQETYGVSTSNDELKLNFKATTQYGVNYGSRMYLMEDENKYQMFKLLDQEFTFDVDVSSLECGLNGALYLVSMDVDGGRAKYPSNKAGAKYGTGYCDSQCPTDIKYINGMINVDKKVGTCCAEMDIWEANKMASAFTPHPCSASGAFTCEAGKCGGAGGGGRYIGQCDPDGCDFNPFRLGNETFYGPGMTVNTNKKFTVVTQFLTDKTTGELNDIKRFYVQDGKLIGNPQSMVSGVEGNSVTKDFCNQKIDKANHLDDSDAFVRHGGLASMGKAISEGMVLVMSLWDDANSTMNWLDSYDKDATDLNKPGVIRGSCAKDAGDINKVRAENPDAFVTFSNIKVGPIGSTFKNNLPSSSSTTSKVTSASSTTTSIPTNKPSTSTNGAAGSTGSPLSGSTTTGRPSSTSSTSGGSSSGVPTNTPNPSVSPSMRNCKPK
eukprot:gene2480-2821_t